MRSALILASIWLPLISCTKKKETTTLLRPVRYVTVENRGEDRIRTFSGASRAGSESKLSFKVAGTIKRIPVQLGSKVKKGALIAEIDNADYALKTQEAEASLKRIEAQARNAKSAYARIRELYENGTASRNDLDAARAANESAQAGVSAGKKKLQLAKRQLRYTKLLAPADSSIASLHAEANENVREGQPIAILAGSSETEVQVNVPESLIGDIEVGSEVKVRFDTIKGKAFEAVVTEVGSTSTVHTTFPVVVRISSKSQQIRPGMAVEVDFQFAASNEKSLIIPLSAVGEDTEGRYVFIVNDTETATQGKIQRLSVKVGQLTMKGIEVVEGLSDGQKVVTAGISQISDGQIVLIPNSSTE